MADQLNIITTDANSVNVTTEDNTVTITNDGDATTVTLSAAETTTVQIVTVGPKGDTGDVGSIDTSTFATTGSNTFSGTQIISGSINVTTGITGSLLGTASFATTASYALNAGAGAGFPFSGSAVITGSLLVTGGITGLFSGSVVGYVPNEATTSFVTNSQTSSFVTNSQTSSFVTNAQTSSFVLNTQTGSMLSPYTLNSRTASFLTTGSQNINQTISGSLTILENLTILGSSSITFISSSTLNVGTNLITVNTINPTNRYGGIAVIDSGSSPLVSASFLYDSVQDEFIFVHKGTAAGAITSSHFVLGPETYDSLGDEIYLTTNRIPKGKGNEHLNDSNITDDGSVVSINSNTKITGSLSQGLEGNIASGIYSHAEGSATSASGEYSHAEGDTTQAIGNYSHAEGQETKTLVSAQYSHAEGYNTIASANYQHVQGQWNATSSVEAAFIVGNGTDNNNRSNLIHAAGSEVQITGSLIVNGDTTAPTIYTHQINPISDQDLYIQIPTGRILDIWTDDNGGEIELNSSGILLRTNATANTWTFDKSGSLTAPGGITAPSFTGSFSGSYVGDGSGLTGVGGGISQGKVVAIATGLSNLF